MLEVDAQHMWLLLQERMGVGKVGSNLSSLNLMDLRVQSVLQMKNAPMQSF